MSWNGTETSQQLWPVLNQVAGSPELKECLALTLRIKQASRNVFGSSPFGIAISQLCDQTRESLEALDDRRTNDSLILAFVGATGQGKSWLIRNWVLDPSLQSSILSGDSQEEATRQLIWIGATPPRDLDSRTEKYLHCSDEHLQPIGTPYLLVDTPGATDHASQTAAMAQRAIEIAGVIVLVVRRQQIRSEFPSRLAEVSDGTLIIPVVTAIRTATDDPALRSDVDAMMHQLRKVAPHSEVLDVELVPDFDLSNQDEASTGRTAAKGIAEKIRRHLQLSDYQAQRRSIRLQSLQQRFITDLQTTLNDSGPILAQAIDRLENAIEQLPHEIAIQLIGSGHVLRVAIRGRMRAETMIGTPTLWFPYRTLLSIFSMTQGAWDRVILALSGSLPSLIGAAWTSVRQWQAEQHRPLADEQSLQNYCRAIIGERITPIVEQFHRELQRYRDESPTVMDRHESSDPTSARLVGLENLQASAQELFERTVVESAPRNWVLQTVALMGTVIFWGLLFAPIAALYSTYFSASYETVIENTKNLDSFPHPTGGMLFTSILLSLLPTALIAMAFLSWSQRRGHQEATARKIESEIAEIIENYQREGVLRLEFHDSMLEDARCLLRVGRATKG